MGMLRRMGDIVTANLNELIDSFEDPETMLKQAVREMETAIRTAAHAAARLVANAKLLNRELADVRRRSKKWQEAAQESVRQGDEAAARSSLARWNEQERLAAVLEKQLAEVEAVSDKLHRHIDSMRARLAESRQRLATTIACSKAAEARKMVASTIGEATIDDRDFGRFEHFCRQLEQSQAEADALADLAAGFEPEDETDAEVDAELERLKREKQPDGSAT